MLSTFFNQPKHNRNPERSLKEDRFPCIEDQKFTANEKCINENIHVDCYDRCNSDSDRSSFNIETENVSRNLDPGDSVKMKLYCQFVQKGYGLYEVN